jgi:hypothetical protein
MARTLSRTTGSSMAARFSRGDRSTWPHGGPPTYSMKVPSSSLSATSTSSSSSTLSAGGKPCQRWARKGGAGWTSPAGEGGGGAGSRLTVEKGNQLHAGALGAQGEGNGRETVDGVKAEDDIVVLEEDARQSRVTGEMSSSPPGPGPYLQFVDEHCDGVELIARIRRLNHDGRGYMSVRSRY